jgi:hypothetical protein
VEVIDELLPYVGALLTVALGLVGFFWARNGDRNKVGGVGWSIAILTVAAGAVTVLQVHRQRENAAKSAARAEELSEELRQSFVRQTFAVVALVGGFDMKAELKQGGFYFEGDADEDGKVKASAGLLGPFAELGQRGRGALSLHLEGVADVHYRLAPDGKGGILVSDAAGSYPAYRLRPATAKDALAEFEPVATAVPSGEPGEWSTAPDVSGYNLTFAADAQVRRLVASLAQQSTFGKLVYDLPDAGAERRSRVVESYRDMRPVLVFAVPDTGSTKDDDCGSYLRIPLNVIHVASLGTRLYFELRPRQQGVEICEGGS